MPLDDLEKGELKELLIKCWMTHDGMWFLHCLKEFGIEKTNKINKAAGRSLAAVEIVRVRKAFGIAKIETFEEFKGALARAREVLTGEFMKFDFNYPAENLMRIQTDKCFAYEGMKRLGVSDNYECGIFSRMEGWFDGLGVKYDVRPRVEGCMMQTEGRCYRNYTFYF